MSATDLPPLTSPTGAVPAATLRVYADGFVWTDATLDDAVRLLVPAVVTLGQLRAQEHATPSP